MRILLAGTRGTTPVTAPDRAVFGGDTTCLLVVGEAGDRVLVDAGTGLRGAAAELPPSPDVLVLLTHFHWDHLAGLPTLPALHDPRARLLFAAPPADGAGVGDAVSGVLGAPFWPVRLDDCPANIGFAELPSASGSEPLRTGGLEIRWAPLPHPGGCTAYRIDEPATGASVVVATDAEWRDAAPGLRDGLVQLCREPSSCDLLVCDAQYDDDVADQRRGWGHGTMTDAVALCRETGAGRLLLTHHDPDHDDDALAAREQRLQALLPGAALARQGAWIDPARKDLP
jgi:ribonuclease BN (tRNA processing enzyme)